MSFHIPKSSFLKFIKNSQSERLSLVKIISTGRMGTKHLLFGKYCPLREACPRPMGNPDHPLPKDRCIFKNRTIKPRKWEK